MDGGDFRTALATPGLLIIVQYALTKKNLYLKNKPQLIINLCGKVGKLGIKLILVSCVIIKDKCEWRSLR